MEPTGLDMTQFAELAEVFLQRPVYLKEGQSLWKQIDADGNGRISKDEWVSFWASKLAEPKMNNDESSPAIAKVAPLSTNRSFANTMPIETSVVVIGEDVKLLIEQRDVLASMIKDRVLGLFQSKLRRLVLEKLIVTGEVQVREGGSTSRGVDQGLADLDLFVVVELCNDLDYAGKMDTDFNVQCGDSIPALDLVQLSASFYGAVKDFIETRKKHEEVFLSGIGWRNKALATLQGEKGFDFDFVLAIRAPDKTMFMVDDGLREDGNHVEPRLVMSDNERSSQRMMEWCKKRPNLRETSKHLKSVMKAGWNKTVYNRSAEQNASPYKRYQILGVHAEELVIAFAKTCGNWNKLADMERVVGVFELLNMMENR